MIITNPNEAYVGMPATFAIGSDSYATEVTAVYYFKSGERKGQVKAVATTRGLFTLRTKGRKAGRLIEAGQEYGTLRLGEAVDYWDPHF